MPLTDWGKMATVRAVLENSDPPGTTMFLVTGLQMRAGFVEVGMVVEDAVRSSPDGLRECARMLRHVADEWQKEADGSTIPWERAAND